MESRRNPAIYRLLSLALYFGDALFTPFFSLFFLSTGLSEIEQSILLAIVPFSLFAGDLFFSFFETSWKRNIFLIRIISILEAAFLILFGLSNSFVYLIFMTVLSAFHNSCLFGLIDGMGATSAKRNKVSFSTIRVMGSLAYIAASLFGYFFLNTIGYTVIFFVAAAFIFLCFPISFLLVPFNDAGSIAIDSTLPQAKKPDRSFFNNPNLWMLLAFCALYYGSWNNYGYVVPIFLKSQGLTDGDTALWTAIRVSIEVVVMLLSPFIMKVLKKQKNILLAACAFQLLCVLFSATITDFGVLLWFAYLSRGISYGLGLVGLILFIEEIVGEKDCPKAVTLATGANYCVCGILNLISSLIYDKIGFTGYFWIIFATMFCGIILLVLIRQKPKKEPATIAAGPSE